MAERRFTPGRVQLRDSAGTPAIGGYAAVFNRHSRNLGGFTEVVSPSFFAKSQSDGWPGVMARYNHDDNMLLGTTAGGTLQLRTDKTGLEYEVHPPSARADVVELVARGDIAHSSFAFVTHEDSWDVSEQGYPLRTLISGQLVDVAPVNSPAYPDSTAGLRSLASRAGLELDEVRRLAEEGKLARLLVRTDRSVIEQGGHSVTTLPSVRRLSGASAVVQLMSRKR